MFIKGKFMKLLFVRGSIFPHSFENVNRIFFVIYHCMLHNL